MKIVCEMTNDILDAVCTSLGYKEQIEDPQNENELINNPETKDNYLKGKIKEYLCSKAESVKLAEARRTMQTTIRTAINSDVSVTILKDPA